MLELVVAAIIYHAAHINQLHGFTPAQFSARGELRRDHYFKGHLLVGVTYVRVAVLRAAQIYHSGVIARPVCRFNHTGHL